MLLFFCRLTYHCVCRECTRSQIPNNFKFKEYCPLVFQNLRRRFHIQDECYQVYWVMFISVKTIVLKAVGFRDVHMT